MEELPSQFEDPQSPLLDTCDLYNACAKHMGRTIWLSQMETLPTFVNNDPLNLPRHRRRITTWDLQKCRENILLLGEKHITAAQAQKKLAES